MDIFNNTGSRLIFFLIYLPIVHVRFNTNSLFETENTHRLFCTTDDIFIKYTCCELLVSKTACLGSLRFPNPEM